VFTEKLKFITVELPKFKKTLEELTTLQDKWLYSLKHMETLSKRPVIMNDEALKLLYKKSKINKLKKEDMEEYEQSVLRYDDLYHVVSFAKEQGRQEGRQERFEEGIEKGQMQIIKALRKHEMSIKQIAEVTGFTEEQVFAILDKD
jgi:predicted transposase/invertase (TIGR01784 family)